MYINSDLKKAIVFHPYKWIYCGDTFCFEGCLTVYTFGDWHCLFFWNSSDSVRLHNLPSNLQVHYCVGPSHKIQIKYITVYDLTICDSRGMKTFAGPHVCTYNIYIKFKIPVLNVKSYISWDNVTQYWH